MNLMTLYGTNEDFKNYVDRYAKHYGISVDVALSHELVKQYANDLMKGNLK